MNDSLDDRIVAALHSESHLEPDMATAFARFEDRRRRRRARLQGMTAVGMVLLVVVIGGVALAGRGGHGSKANITAGGPEPTGVTGDEPQPGTEQAPDTATSTSALQAPAPITPSGGGTGTRQTVVGTVVTVPPGTTPPTTQPRATTTSPPGQQHTVTVTEADSGKSYTLRRGDRLVVQLNGNGYEWTEPASSNDTVLHRTSGSSGTTATGTFSAVGPGTADVTSTGDAPCRRSTPPCMVPSRLFQVSVTVAG
jgi:hypothetical protein